MRFLVFVFIFMGFLAVLPVTTYGETVTDLKSDSHSVIARLELLLSPETKTIDISTYQLIADEVGSSLMAALIDAAQRGVKVRLLVDNKIDGANATMLSYLQDAGVEVRYFNEVKVRFTDLLNPWGAFDRMNRRMHDKIFLVNKTKAIVGDKNYSDKFFRTSLKSAAQHTMLGKEFYVEGAESGEVLLQQFERLWNGTKSSEASYFRLSDKEKNRIDKTLGVYHKWNRQQVERRRGVWQQDSFKYSSVEMLADREGVSGKETTLHQILSLISQAPDKAKVLIENSYFVLFPELEVALKAALKRGVQIHVVLNAPEVTDIKIIGDTLQKDLPRMVDLGLHVYLNTAKRRITHAKLVLIGEDTVINGSSNIDPRSYRLNSESSLMLKSPELNAQMWQRFEKSKPFMKGLSKFTGECSRVFMEAGTKGPSFPKNMLIEMMRSQL